MPRRLLLAAAAVACTALVFLVMRDKAAYPHQLFSTGVDAPSSAACVSRECRS